MPHKPFESYERVPYRGTFYVEAAALDFATAHIKSIETELAAKGGNESAHAVTMNDALLELRGNVALLEGQLADANKDKADSGLVIAGLHGQIDKAAELLANADNLLTLANGRIAELEANEKARNEAVVDKPAAT